MGLHQKDFFEESRGLKHKGHKGHLGERVPESAGLAAHKEGKHTRGSKYTMDLAEGGKKLHKTPNVAKPQTTRAPEVTNAGTFDEFKKAYEKFVAKIQSNETLKLDQKGHLSIARQCINGLDKFWGFNRKRGEIYQYLKEGDEIVGLARIEVPAKGDVAKIQDVVAYPGQGYGKTLIDQAINEARAAGKKKIWLEAADEGVAQYYKKTFNFDFEKPGAKSGTMTLDL